MDWFEIGSTKGKGVAILCTTLFILLLTMVGDYVKWHFDWWHALALAVVLSVYIALAPQANKENAKNAWNASWMLAVASGLTTGAMSSILESPVGYTMLYMWTLFSFLGLFVVSLISALISLLVFCCFKWVLR